jgi:hypothetical protein
MLCQVPGAKAVLPSEKPLPRAVLGKAHMANFRPAHTSLPSAFCRALGKEKWPWRRSFR